MNGSRRNQNTWLVDVLAMLILAAPVISIVLNGRLAADVVIWGDTPWYLNRAALIGRGILNDAFVYTLGFPLVVALVHAFVPDLIAAGLAVNWLALYGLFLGIYTLGRMVCGRKVGLLAILPAATSIAFFNYARHMQTWLLFTACVVWCVVAYVLLVRRPGFFHAVVLGVALAFTFFTRLEGISYSLLIVAAAWQTFRKSRNGWHTLTIAAVSGGIVAAAVLAYFSILLPQSDPASGDAFAVLKLLRANPVDWEGIRRRVEELLQSMGYVWPVGAWLIAACGLFVTRPERRAVILFLSMIAINAANLLLVAIAPTPQLTLPSLPFLALLTAAVLVDFSRRRPAWWFVVPLLMLSLTTHGTRVLVRYASALAAPYWETVQAHDARQIDTWLRERQLNAVEVYTFCQEVVPYSSSQLQLIYRLAFRPLNSGDWWNTPERLLPRMKQHGHLLMVCPERQIYLRDWADFLAELPDHPERLERIGAAGQYEFYRVPAEVSS